MISPVWFPVPPTGYGGIEWVVWLLADGLVDAGHDVTLFASGDSHTKATLVVRLPEAPERADRPDAPGAPALPRLLRARRRVRRDQRPLRPAGGGDRRPDRDAGRCTRSTARSTARAARSTSRSPRSRRAIGFISISMNQRKPKPDLPWVANCPNALDFSLYPVEAAPRRLPALPRPDEPGQGLPPRDRRRDRGGPAAEDRRQEARAARAAVLRRVRRAAPAPTRSSTSARSRTARRSSCSRTRARRCSRSSGRSRSAS